MNGNWNLNMSTTRYKECELCKDEQKIEDSQKICNKLTANSYALYLKINT